MDKIILNRQTFSLRLVPFQVSFRETSDPSKLYIYGIWFDIKSPPGFEELDTVTFGSQLWRAIRSRLVSYRSGANYLFWNGHWWQLTKIPKTPITQHLKT